MMTYEFGEVVLVAFPQSGTAVRKQRPALVVLDIGTFSPATPEQVLQYRLFPPRADAILDW
jgi:hypothetical protein